jgi:hypothetical protein
MIDHTINKKRSQPDLPPLPRPPQKTPLPTERIPPCSILSTESPYWDSYCSEHDKAVPPLGPPNPVPTGPHMPLWGLVLFVIVAALLLAYIFKEWMV